MTEAREVTGRAAAWLLAAALACTCTAAIGAELKLGLARLPTSLDPHFEDSLANNTVLAHLYDTLVVEGDDQQLLPGLAYRWVALSDTEWEFTLRPGVLFSDGTPFGADDVVYSLERARQAGQDGRGFGAYVEGKTAVAVDPLTVRIRTEAPDYAVPRDMARLFIVSRAAAGEGRGNVGTGRYRPAPAEPGVRGFVLERNERFWGLLPEWTRAVLRVIPDPDARVEALLAGEVDVVDEVPGRAVGRIASSPRHHVIGSLSARLRYLQLDQARAVTVHVRNRDGVQGSNALRDVRVRRALSKAIDRDLLVAGALEGDAGRAGQIVPPGLPGHDAATVPVDHDPEGARALLAEAGFADGLQVDLHLPEGRYRRGREAADAIARMWREVGVAAAVKPLPEEEFFERASRGGPRGTPEFGLLLLGWDSREAEALGALEAVVHSFDLEAGLGLVNRGRYANAEVDGLIEQARASLDPAARAELSAQASRIAMAEVAIVPLYFELNIWGLRSGLRHADRVDGRTTVYYVRSE